MKMSEIFKKGISHTLSCCLFTSTNPSLIIFSTTSFREKNIANKNVIYMKREVRKKIKCNRLVFFFTFESSGESFGFPLSKKHFAISISLPKLSVFSSVFFFKIQERM